MNPGHRLRVDGEGHEGIHGGQNGALYITVSEKPHESFTRDGADLHCIVPISFPTAALGGQVSAPTLDDLVKIKVPEGSQSGTVLRVKHRGLPHLNGAEKGHLYVKLAVDTPQKLSESQKRLLEAFEESLSNQDRAAESQRGDGGVLSWLSKFF